MRREVTLGAALLFLLAACGSDAGGDSETERGEEYVDAVVSAVFAETDEATTEEERDDFRCVMAGWVDVIGLDALNEAEVTPENFAAADNFPAAGLEVSEDQAADAADAFFGCVDVVEFFVLEESTAEEKECARNAIDDKTTELRESLRDDLLGRTETDFTTAIDELLIDQCDISIYRD
jgi:hypothetical protein